MLSGYHFVILTTSWEEESLTQIQRSFTNVQDDMTLR